MTIQQIENLLAAGFNHDEIMQLARDEPGPAAPEPEKEAAPEPVNPAAPDPEPGPAAEKQEPEKKDQAAAPENTETNNRLDALEKSIADLVKTIQTQNVKNDSFGGMPDSLEQQTDKIMMSIIRPDIERKAN